MGQVTINGNTYIYIGEIQRAKLPPLSPPIRTQGIQRFEDIQTASSVKFPVPSLGFGLARIRDINDPRQYLRFWNSTLETRFGSAVTLPPLDQNATDPASNAPGASRFGGLEHKGTLSGFWTNFITPNYEVEEYEWDGDWDNITIIIEGTAGLTTNPPTIFDGCIHKTERFCLYAWANDHKVRAAAASSWSDAGGTGWPANLFANSVTFDEDLDGGLLLDFGDTLLAYLWDETNAEVEVWKSTDAGANWSSVVNIPSGNGPTGKAIYFDQDGTVAPLVGTREGVYAIDIAGSTADLILSLRSQPDDNNCRRMTVWNGRLYVPTGDGGMLRYGPLGNGVWEAVPVGPNLDDGLPSDRQGYVTSMVATNNWLLVAYGGASASTKASIFAYEEQHEHLLAGDRGGWHHLWQNATANRKIDWLAVSEQADGTVRLHWSVRTATNDTDMRYMEKPLTNPQSETVANEASGFVERPDFNAGFPRFNAAWLQLAVDAADLSAATTGEHINESYFLNGGTGETALGHFLSGDKDLDLGSGAGVSAVSFRSKETLKRDSGGANTDTPRLREVEWVYQKRPPAKYDFTMTLDLVKSAEVQRAPVETVVSRLTTAESTVTLIALLHRGVSSTNVLVEDLAFLDTIPAQDKAGGEQRGSFARIVLREVG